MGSKSLSFLGISLVSLLVALALQAQGALVNLPIGVITTNEAWLVGAENQQSIIQMALDKVNAEQIVPGANFTLLMKDDHANALDSVKAGINLIESHGIVAAVGSLTSVVTIPLTYTFGANAIPLCSAASTSSVLSDKTNFPYFIRAIPDDDLKATAMADFVFAMGWRKVGVISSSDQYGQGMLVKFEERCASLGITITISTSIISGTPNCDSVMQVFKEQQVRIVLVLALPPDMVTVLRSAKKLNILTFEFVYIGAELDGIWQILEPGEVGIIKGVTYAKPNDLASSDFTSQWNSYVVAKNLTSPTLPNYGTYFYDCILSFAYGFAKLLEANPSANVTTLANRENGAFLDYALFDFPNVEGAAGPLSYDNEGNRIGGMVVMNFVDDKGTLAEVATWKPSGLNIVKPPIFFDGTTDIPLDGIKVDPVPIIVISALVAVVIAIYLLLHRFQKDNGNTSFLTVVFAMGGLAVHISFLTEQYQIKSYAVFIAGVVFLGFSVLLNIALLGVFLTSHYFRDGDLAQHMKKNRWFTTVSLMLGALNIEAFLVIKSHLFNLEGLAAKMDSHQENAVKAMGLTDTIIKTLPMLCLQIFAVGEFSWTTINIISIVTSIVVALFGLTKGVVFIFYDRRRIISTLTARNNVFYSTPQGDFPVVKPASDFELRSKE